MNIQQGHVLADALATPEGARADAGWRTRARPGPPRRVIPKAVKTSESDLLALGTHGSRLARPYLGTVAGDVLRDVTCDVLVVPPRRRSGR